MKEIGGYIELEYSRGKQFYQDAINLNCGRNCLGYLIETYNIKKIYIPYFLCSSVTNICKKYRVDIEYYRINELFEPIIPDSYSSTNWFYLVNYYGQISNSKIKKLHSTITNLIVDNAQAFFQQPVDGIPTIYTCRKFFGVSDGAYLCNSNKISRELEQDYSFDRMKFLMGRFERTANEFYSDYNNNNKLFASEDIKIMSKLTQNFLSAIKYDFVRKTRKKNFDFLYNRLASINKLVLNKVEGAFAYPLYLENGSEIRKKLQEQKIYIPTLWPDVFEMCGEDMLENQLAKNVLPIPVDQRYGIEEMKIILELIIK